MPLESSRRHHFQALLCITCENNPIHFVGSASDVVFPAICFAADWLPSLPVLSHGLSGITKPEGCRRLLDIVRARGIVLETGTVCDSSITTLQLNEAASRFRCWS